ncbi:MAG: hypothetical protein V3T26_06020 [candidate division NC10 bacterium]
MGLAEMSQFFTNYDEAYAYAVERVRKLSKINMPMGLGKCKEYDREGFRVAMVPRDPCNRQGWETRCQIVDSVDVMIFDGRTAT